MKLNRLVDSIALFGVSLILLTAFYFQLIEAELPCALCNLERAGFMIFGGGLLLNVLHDESFSGNYVISALGALIGSVIGLFHMFVKVLPGTPPTGTTVLGMHMYTATYVALTLVIFYCIFMLALAPQWSRVVVSESHLAGRWVRWVAVLFTVLTFANLASTFLENGFHPFEAGGQQHYQMLYNGDVMKP